MRAFLTVTVAVAQRGTGHPAKRRQAGAGHAKLRAQHSPCPPSELTGQWESIHHGPRWLTGLQITVLGAVGPCSSDVQHLYQDVYWASISKTPTAALWKAGTALILLVTLAYPYQEPSNHLLNQEIHDNILLRDKLQLLK